MPAPSPKRSFAGFPDNSERHARGDRKNIDNAAKRAGWDRHAGDFRALARDLARIALDHPPIWRGVINLATALHARYWPMSLDERWPGADEAGEHTKTMPGAEAMAILAKPRFQLPPEAMHVQQRGVHFATLLPSVCHPLVREV
jgi:hypothetical protein